MIRGKEWIGFPHCVFWQSLFLLTWEYVGIGGHHPYLLLGRYPEQVHGGRRAVSLSSPSSWDHQLGLALRSRWDIEIPDCP